MKTKTSVVMGKRDFTSGPCYWINLKDWVGKGCHEGVSACLSTQLVAVAAASPQFPFKPQTCLEVSEIK